MSRIGKQPIKIEKDVEVKVNTGSIRIKGPKGELKMDYNPRISIAVEGEMIQLSRPTDSKPDRALHGTYRSLVANMIIGVREGFSKALRINGVGYRAQVNKDKLVLNIGKSHPVEVDIPKSIEINVEKNTMLTVSGIDKQLVGAIAADIRALYPPEPYQGKGIQYADEHVRRKAGKTGA